MRHPRGKATVVAALNTFNTAVVPPILTYQFSFACRDTACTPALTLSEMLLSGELLYCFK